MCEPQQFAPGTSPDEGITEEMDRILADRATKNKVQTWEDMWRLLFGPETMVLEPGNVFFLSCPPPSQDREPNSL